MCSCGEVVKSVNDYLSLINAASATTEIDFDSCKLRNKLSQPTERVP